MCKEQIKRYMSWAAPERRPRKQQTQAQGPIGHDLNTKKESEHAPQPRSRNASVARTSHMGSSERTRGDGKMRTTQP